MKGLKKEGCGLEIPELEAIFIAYKKDVYRYLLSLTHSADAAEELLSETFLKALQGLGRFQGGSTVKTWLFGIARNLWLQSLRKRKKDASLDDAWSLYIAEDAPEDAIDGRELATRARALLGQKSERVRRVMSMRIDGYAPAGIAAACGISENSVRVMEFRTKKWLRECLQKEGLL